MVTEKLNEDESMSEEIRPFRKMFLGGVIGVVLRERGANDTHVIFQLIHEDDGYWFLSTSGASSFWFDDYQDVLAAAKSWCEANCDPDIVDGQQYGWRFRN